MNNIFLIGMMGSGKSTIGKLLSKELDLSFADTDEMILERSSEKTISDIFAKYGEDHFRNLEKKVLKEITHTESVIATGGGIILSEDNVKEMNKKGIVVYLYSTIDNLVKNLSTSSDRPLLEKEDTEKKLVELLNKRASLYKNACEVLIDVSFKSKEDIVHLIKEKIDYGSLYENISS